MPVDPGDPLPDPPFVDPEDDDVTIDIVEGDLPEGVELIDGQFVGIPTEEGAFEIVFRVCDGGVPQSCADHGVIYFVGEIPWTGSNSRDHLQWAILLIMLGGWLLLFAKRRDEEPAEAA